MGVFLSVRDVVEELRGGSHSGWGGSLRLSLERVKNNVILTRAYRRQGGVENQKKYPKIPQKYPQKIPHFHFPHPP
jgi:hypothetical protein